MLPKVIADLSVVEEKYRVLYTKQEDGTYKLDEGVTEDVTGLKNTNIALKQEKLELKQKYEELLQFKKQKEEEELLAEKKYKELLESKETSFKTELEKAKEEITKLHNTIKQTKLDEVVTSLATELAGENALLLKPHIQQKVKVELMDGVPEARFINDVGESINKDTLLTEFKNIKAFQAVIKGRNSSGGGAGGGAGDPSANDGSYDKYFDENSPSYSPTKQYELQQSNPQLHDALFAKYLAGKY
jgi:hypothetical protein